MARAPVRSRFTIVRVSRGVSALGPTMNVRARSHSPGQPCDCSEERDQRCVRFVSASQHSTTSTRIPCAFRSIVTDSSPGVYSMGCRPTETGDLARFTTRRVASADRACLAGACSSVPASIVRPSL